MKKVFALLLLVLVGFLVVNRRRVYLRDPLATVTRDGTAVRGVKVLINYPNDVLLDDTSVEGRRRLYIVQHWDRSAGTPTAPLRCIYGMACLTDADQAAMDAITPAAQGTVEMSDRTVTFFDEEGSKVKVSLR